MASSQGSAAVAAERTSPVRIDGGLDDAAWRAAVPVGGFVQAEPVEGAPVDQPTEVRILFDEEAVYIGARMYDASPATIARQLVRRDEVGQYDYFEVSLDPDLDRRTGYRFRVTAAGVQIDDYLFDDVREDRSWDAVWQSGVRRDDQGWTAEMRIPLSQIRFQPSASPQEWGVNFGRRRLASNELSFFALESRRQHGRVSVFRTLSGLVLPHGVRRIEARPYTLARSLAGPTEPGNPFFDGREESAGAGLDLRYGIGSTFTLDATFNPDFGQVEVDPAVINLSAFETIYPERRPFFVEDARIFDFKNISGNSLFYSRRIGRQPQRSNVPGATFVNAADETSILGAAKLTGRTSRGLSLGVLAAVTGREEAEAYFAEGDSMAIFLAEPRSGYGVVRALQELRGGRTVVGGIATLMRRNLPSDGSFDFLPSSAMSAGVNFEHTWNDRAWALWGFLAGSQVRGSEEALVRLQHSPTHYFQRPDAYRLQVDSSANSMTGAEWGLRLDRRSGRWTGALWAAQRSPGFEVNDLGEVGEGERLDGGARLTFRDITPGKLFRDYSVGFTTFHNFRQEILRDPVSWSEWGRAHSEGMFGLTGSATLLNYRGLNATLQYDPENFDSEVARGGPLMLDPAAWVFNLRGNTDRRDKLSFEPSFGVDNGGAFGWGWKSGMKVSYRPSSRVQIEAEPSYQSQPDAAQYVATTGNVGYAPTYGPRYLFADLDRRTFSLPTRLNVTFSRSLTLQLFAQPLLSVGDFTVYKQLARAESFDFDRFEEGVAATGLGAVSCVGGRTCRSGNQRLVDFDGDGGTDFSFREKDFRVRSLRGNAVLRWEYRPGSTLFFVWQQRRSYQDLEANTFRLGGEALDLLTDRPTNVFIIKANYWLSL
ncbi:MAG TPA: DUF5916 domain-containing protein [Longimicrobiaceae bacterium]